MRLGLDALAAGDVAGARRLLEYAHRCDPEDAAAALARAQVLLRLGDPGAVDAFAGLAAAEDVREAWFGWAASLLDAGAADAAQARLAEALRRHAPSRDEAVLACFDRIAAAGPGWCGLTGDGMLLVSPLRAGSLAATLDGMTLQLPRSEPGQRIAVRLPERWRATSAMEVALGGAALLGSPLAPSVIGRTVGFVAARGGGIEGWARLPADADQEVILTLESAEAAPVPLRVGPMGFRLAADALPAGAITLRGPDGRPLLGSPLDPGAEARAAAAAARATAARHRGRRAAEAEMPDNAMPAWADAIPPPRPPGPAAASPPAAAPQVDVVIPVHDGGPAVLACLAGVLETLPAGSRAIVVDDASTEAGLLDALAAHAAAGRIRLLRRPGQGHFPGRFPGGFPAAANAGIAAASGRDVILLNSDTLVAPGWIEGLRAAAYAAPDIGSATPFSNDATILSFPALSFRAPSGNPVPDRAGVRRLAALAADANAGTEPVEIPTGVGFCLYLRRDCLAETGLLREAEFAQGYGEENDFCLRARHLGWRHVAASGVYVGHVGGASFEAAFGAARRALLARNVALLNRLHPGYDALIAAHVAADPLAPARRRIAALEWRAAAGGAVEGAGGSVVLVSHDAGGGVARLVAERAGAIEATGRRAVVLRPAVDAAGARIAGGVVVGENPALRYVLPAELDALAALLAPDRPELVELHHLLGHDPAITDLAAALGVPFEVHVHDYHWFCPRIALVGRERRYCGEPERAVCAECVADLGSNLEEDIAPAALHARSAALLAAAERVVAPSADAAARMRRQFPGLRPAVRPWEDDAAVPEPAERTPGAILRVLVAGAIGLEKGYEVLLACARDAARRRLALGFVVVGHTVDDARLWETGTVVITGGYEEHECDTLIRAEAADLGFLPSLWPETWSYALSALWRGGLDVAVFDLGAPAERVRATGRGWVLPLGLAPAAVNNALFAAVESRAAFRRSALAEDRRRA